MAKDTQPEDQRQIHSEVDPSMFDLNTPTPKHMRGLLQEAEFFWRDHHDWLVSCGYQLRPRYAPGWTPSWNVNTEVYSDFEDGQIPTFNHLMDATRISDGLVVMLKRIHHPSHLEEVDITRFFSTEPLASDSNNHCIPLYETLQVPDDSDKIILVLPLLRPYEDPRFDTLGEVIDFFDQIFEGLRFMHKYNVAHRDYMDMNIMMDPTSMYPESFHPFAPDIKRDISGKAVHYTRTQRPPKYYLIDFGISRRYTNVEGQMLEAERIMGGDKTAPELQGSESHYDPFALDVYYFGNLLRESFVQRYEGFTFMKPLMTAMVQTDPAKRPTMEEVVERFSAIKKELSSWKLRSRVIRRRDSVIFGFFRTFSHWSRRIGFIAQGVHPIPVRKS